VITVLPLNFKIASAVTARLRDADAVEIFGLRHDGPTPEGRAALAREASYCASVGCGWGVLVDGDAVAVLGAHEMWPGAWSVFAFGTDAWLTAARTVTRIGLERLRPLLIERGCRFAEALSHERHVTAHAWMRRYGARVEAVHTGFGRDGSAYFRFVWRPPACSTSRSPEPSSSVPSTWRECLQPA
jgi:hypothetical protein